MISFLSIEGLGGNAERADFKVPGDLIVTHDHQAGDVSVLLSAEVKDTEIHKMREAKRKLRGGVLRKPLTLSFRSDNGDKIIFNSKETNEEVVALVQGAFLLFNSRNK